MASQHPSATGISLNLKFKKDVSCRKIDLKCIVELVNKASNTSIVHFFTNNNINSGPIIRYFFAVVVSHLPVIAPETCQKIKKLI